MATATKSAAPAEPKGAAWLAEHVNSTCGTSMDGYGIRILLRRLVKEGTIERGEGRYSFTGPRDPQVVAVVKAVKAGEVDKAKSERLEKLKEAKATKAPAKKAAPAKEKAAAPARRSRAKAKPAPVEAEDDLDIDDLEV